MCRPLPVVIACCITYACHTLVSKHASLYQLQVSPVIICPLLVLAAFCFAHEKALGSLALS